MLSVTFYNRVKPNFVKFFLEANLIKVNRVPFGDDVFAVL